MPQIPQDASAAQRAERQQRITDRRGQYQWDHDFLKPLPLIEAVPLSEFFTPRYLAERAASVAGLPVNAAAVKARQLFDPFDKLDDYADLFPVLAKPSTINNYRTDRSFAEQRVSGANPLVLELCTDAGSLTALKFSDAMVAQVYPGLDLAGAVKDRKLFIADYRGFLAGIHRGSNAAGRKFLPAPVALFGWRELGQQLNNSPRGEFVPIAILKKEGQTPVTPQADPMAWFVAKLAVQVADANYHEMSSHLTRTHFVMEPFAVALARTVDVDHPISALLEPHFQFLLANNDLGKRLLINPGGAVDLLLGGSIDESLGIVKQSYNEWSFDKHTFRNDIKGRGLDSVDAFPHYPYRDDGMLVWNAIHNFVSNYLKIYYADDAQVAGDPELQAFLAELNAPATTGAGMQTKGIPTSLGTMNALSEFLTDLVFINGPIHSAVNFTQYDYMAFCPNQPLAAYSDLTGDFPDDPSLMKALPPFQFAMKQLDVLAFLSFYRYDRLGFYDSGMLNDGKIADVLATFRQELAEVENRIRIRNNIRTIPYTALLPSQVINSISV